MYPALSCEAPNKSHTSNTGQKPPTHIKSRALTLHTLTEQPGQHNKPEDTNKCFIMCMCHVLFVNCCGRPDTFCLLYRCLLLRTLPHPVTAVTSTSALKSFTSFQHPIQCNPGSPHHVHQCVTSTHPAMLLCMHSTAYVWQYVSSLTRLPLWLVRRPPLCLAPQIAISTAPHPQICLSISTILMAQPFPWSPGFFLAWLLTPEFPLVPSVSNHCNTNVTSCDDRGCACCSAKHFVHTSKHH